MTDLGTASVGLGLDLSGFTSGLGEATKMLSGFGLGAVVATGAAVVALGASTVKMAGDFQQSMTQLVTSAGESESNLKLVSDGILAMSVETATSTSQMAAGMYMVESAGFHGAAGLNVLKLAAEGAKAENADLGVVANAVTSALNSYGLGADKAAFVTNVLVASTAAGKMHMQDLAGAVSNVLPATSKFHISLIDTTAALATMTMQGDDASSAATHLRQMILALEAPSNAGAKALASIGLSTAQVTAEMQVSLPGAIQMITDALGKRFPEGSAAYNQALKNIAGGSKQLMGMLELSGTSLEAFKNNVASVTSAVNKGGNAVMGWDLIQQNWNFKVAQAKAQAETWGITLGTKLLPGLEAVGAEIAKDAGPQIQALGGWLTKNLIPAASNAAVLFDKDVLPSLKDLAQFTGHDVVPVVGQLAVWIATKAVPAAIQLEGTLDRALVPVLKTVFSVLGHDVIPQVEKMGDTIFTRLLPPVEHIITKLSPVLVPAFQLVGWVLGHVVGPALNLAIGILADFWGMIDKIIGKIGDLLGKLGQFKDAIGGALGGAGNALHGLGIPGFASGTAYAPGGLAVVGEHGPEVVDLPQGSRVYPTGTGPTNASSGGGKSYHVHVTNQAPSMSEIAIAFRRMEVLYG